MADRAHTDRQINQMHEHFSSLLESVEKNAKMLTSEPLKTDTRIILIHNLSQNSSSAGRNYILK